ncbi:MAG: hypothetical protein K0Q47_35 [Sedimentibacter sp.]|jgi:hypothetical protein|nr:hypothetical protein [Sedimentibacter sp.]
MDKNGKGKAQVKEEVKKIEDKSLVDAKASEAKQEVKEAEKVEVKQETETPNPPAEEPKQEPAEQAPENSDKKSEDKKESQKQEVKPTLTESEKALMAIQSLINRNSSLKIVPSDSKTGVSYFTGKKRLCKLIKTKRGVTIEINVALSEDLKKLPGMENISATTAYKKHLGTMKHIYKAPDSKQVSAIMKEAIALFKAEIEAEKAKEQAQDTKTA